MEPKSPSQKSHPDRSDSGPDLRGDIPPTPNAPDRAVWVSRGFPEPVELKEVPQRFATRALLHIERDYSTLSFDEAIRWQTAMDALCFQVLGYVEDAKPSDLVFFDTETKSFWLYRKEE